MLGGKWLRRAKTTVQGIRKASHAAVDRQAGPVDGKEQGPRERASVPEARSLPVAVARAEVEEEARRVAVVAAVVRISAVVKATVVSAAVPMAAMPPAAPPVVGFLHRARISLDASRDYRPVLLMLARRLRRARGRQPPSMRLVLIVSLLGAPLRDHRHNILGAQEFAGFHPHL